jgi:zinc protease
MIAGVNPTNIEKSIQLITEEVKRFVTEPVSEEELADTQSYFRGRMPLLLESNAGVAVSLLNMERFDLGLDYFQKYPRLISEVTSQDVLRTTRKYLDPDRLAIAIAGP